MERIKTKIIIAVAERLRDARDTDAKTDLIEELSENLYQRYVDLVASGVEENEAFRCAMEDLGDVSELLEYLDEMESEEAEETEECRGRIHFNDLMRGLEDVVRETISQTRDAVDQAKIITKDLAKKFNEKYPEGIKVHCGFDSEKGGFFWESNRKGRLVEIAKLPADSVRALDIQLHNGDVNLRIEEQDAVEVNGDAEDLEVRLDDDGVLYIRQGRTASSTVIFGRGLARTDLELILPKKVWEFVRINTVNGDVELADLLEANVLDIQTVSGDISADRVRCPGVNLTSISGDIRSEEMEGNVTADSKSGDIILSGSFTEVKGSSMSGDVEFIGTAARVSCSSMSGDVSVETGVLPGELNASSKSGDCCVRVPSGEGFAVVLHTVSGDIFTDFELAGTIGKKSGGAVYLDGGNRSFSISSISGDVSLNKI